MLQYYNWRDKINSSYLKNDLCSNNFYFIEILPSINNFFKYFRGNITDKETYEYFQKDIIQTGEEKFV